MLKTKIEEFFQKETGKISVVLKNLTNDEWIYQINEQNSIPSASIIKILIMVTALEQIQQGRFQLEDKISIMETDKVDYSIMSNLTTDAYTLHDIITLMMIVSDNTATNVLIDLLGFDAINNMAAMLAIKHTQLQRKMMDFNAVRMGRQNTTCAADIAKLMEEIYKGHILNEEHTRLAIDIMKAQKDRMMLGRYIDGQVIIAHKTGDLPNLNHDIGIFYLPKITYLLGVFVVDAESNLAAQQMIGRISKLVYDFYISN